uniref:PHB domain-containing protein n=1 Tax=Hymenolepis diminuta TaxID=6216 RepID=A0A0R3SU13_HYMDI
LFKKLSKLVLKQEFVILVVPYFIGVESEVGSAVKDVIKKQNLKRENFFITSKIIDIHFISYTLALDLIDSREFICENRTLEDTKKAMEKIAKERLAKSAGVPKFNKRQIGRISTAVNKHLKEIRITAYAPGSRLGLLQNPVVISKTTTSESIKSNYKVVVHLYLTCES